MVVLVALGSAATMGGALRGSKTVMRIVKAGVLFFLLVYRRRSGCSKSLLPEVHQLYFEPQYAEFSARTVWSLSNALTSAFKKLDPIPQFKATAKQGGFLAQLPA